MIKGPILEDTTVVAGHVPVPIVNYLDARLKRGWKNRAIILLCEALQVAREADDWDSFGETIERALLAMARNEETRQKIYDKIHEE